MINALQRDIRIIFTRKYRHLGRRASFVALHSFRETYHLKCTPEFIQTLRLKTRLTRLVHQFFTQSTLLDCFSCFCKTMLARYWKVWAMFGIAVTDQTGNVVSRLILKLKLRNVLVRVITINWTAPKVGMLTRNKALQVIRQRPKSACSANAIQRLLTTKR